MCDQIVSVAEQVRANTIKAYAIASAQRSPALPDVPTTKEAGLPEYQIEAWNGIAGPKGMSADDVAVGRVGGRGDDRAALGGGRGAPFDREARGGAARLWVGGQPDMTITVRRVHRSHVLKRKKAPGRDRPGPSGPHEV